MSGSTIAAFEHAINAASDALADHIAAEREVIFKAERGYEAAHQAITESVADVALDAYLARKWRANERVAKLEELRTTLRALGDGFGAALPQASGPDQDLLR